jgi:hypothetical protein
MATFRAAYIHSDAASNGVGILLTTEYQSYLPDADLLAAAKELASEIGADGEIIIGEWRD